MGLTVSKAESAPPPMPNFTKAANPVLESASKDLKEASMTSAFRACTAHSMDRHGASIALYNTDVVHGSLGSRCSLCTALCSTAV